jgi:O-antigen/teichoic acid export membrane protein
MNFKGKEKLIHIIEIVHLRFFGHKMSEKMRSFLGNLSWSFFGGITAGVLFFISTVIAGRFLGPEEFGKYNIVIMISQLLLIPMLLGMDITSTRFISRITDKKKQSKYISTALSVVGISIFITGGVFLLLHNTIIHYAHLDNDMMPIIIVVSVIMASKMLFDGYMRGLRLFEYQAIVRMIEAVVVFFVLIISLFLMQEYKYNIYVISIIIGAGLVSILYFVRIKQYINIKFDINILKQLFGYGKFVIIGSIFGVVLMLGDKFLINTYLGSEELGIYMAYYTVSISLVMQLTAIIINVFFPDIAGVDDKVSVMKKIEKMMLIGFIPLTLILGLFIFLFVHLFGQEYPVVFSLIFLFAILSALQFFVPFFASIVNVHSRQTYFWGLSLLAMRASIFVLYVILLIVFDYFTIHTLLIGLILNYVVDIFNLRFIIKKYARRKI